jgi:hypothetical protein
MVVSGVSVDAASGKGIDGSSAEPAQGRLPVPAYTTLCRRRRKLEVNLPRRTSGESLELVVDVTGNKVWAKARGKSDATSGLSGACGINCMLGWMKPMVRMRRPSFPVISVMESYCVIYLSKLISPSLKFQAIEPTTRVSAMQRSTSVRHCQQSRRRGARIWQYGNSSDPPRACDENLWCSRRIGRKHWKH